MRISFHGRYRNISERTKSLASRIEELATSDTGFVFDPSSGSTFTVNATGLCVLRALKNGLSQGDIAARIRESFDVRAGDPASDLGDFIALLAQHGLVSGERGTL